MNLRQAARPALAGSGRFYRVLVAVAVLLAGLSSSCGGGSSSSSSTSHNAYVTLPQRETVLLLHINDSSGVISSGAETVPRVNTSPTGLALGSTKKSLYVVNAAENTVSVFNIAGDGTLTLSGTPIPTGFSPRTAIVDPSGKFLLVTNAGASGLTGSVSLYSIDSGSGALAEVSGSPFDVGPNPTDLRMTGNFVYVALPNSGVVTAFLLANTTLSPIGTFSARPGVTALAIDPNGHFLYTANASDNSVSAFTIAPATGVLAEVIGSPYSIGTATSPRGLGIDSSSKFLYVANQGTNNILGFTITSGSGTLAAITTGFPVTTGTAPLFLVLEPAGEFLYTGNQTGTNISGFSFDPSTGALTAITGSPFTIASTPGAMQIVH